MALRQLARSAIARSTRRLASTSVAPAPRLYCPRAHIWIDVGVLQPPATSSVQLLRVGLTYRGLEDVGDVTAFRPLVSVGTAVAAAQPVFGIDWESFHITDGDELYHTKWANVDGETLLAAPFDGTIAAFAPPLRSTSSSLLDEEDWLLELEVTVDDATDAASVTQQLLARAPHLVSSEEQYSSLVEASEDSSGMFGERGEERLKYTSYG